MKVLVELSIDNRNGIPDIVTLTRFGTFAGTGPVLNANGERIGEWEVTD